MIFILFLSMHHYIASQKQPSRFPITTFFSHAITFISLHHCMLPTMFPQSILLMTATNQQAVSTPPYQQNSIFLQFALVPQ